ncbi:MAG: hypothetical protein IJW29_06190 [Clostridia bacterium]|nr:hypothetical protein [Clostridia bacterium]
MKAYTTPEVRMQLEGAEDILANAEKIVFTAETHGVEVSKEKSTDLNEVAVESDTIIVKYTQDETAVLGPGTIRFEATIKLADGTVVKSETVSCDMTAAVREELE